MMDELDMMMVHSESEVRVVSPLLLFSSLHLELSLFFPGFDWL